MRRFLRFAASLLALLATPLLHAAPQPRAVFGPERFVRATGGTTTFNRSFTVPAYVAAPHKLTIVNGDPDPVSSASVLVDGVEVASPNDFSNSGATIEKTLTLSAGAHTLEVRLNGAPDSSFRLTISGVIPLGDLAAARAAHTATLLGDGRVLIAGGRNSSGPVASSEIFDPSTLTSAASAAHLSAPRADHAASSLALPQVLLAGGTDASGTRADAEVYRGNAFSSLAASAQISRSGHTATILRDGRVLILGGLDASGNTLTPAEAFDPNDNSLAGAIYDPASGTFKSLPHALRVARANHTATVLPDGRVLVAGGRNTDGYLSSAEVFDPETGQSTLLASSLAVARAAQTATLRANGSVLIAGGRNGAGLTNTIEVFSTATQSFASSSATLLRARADHSATLLPSGEILIAGGEAIGGITNHTELIGPPAADTTAPSATVFPADHATNVDLNAIVAIRFSEPIAVTSLGAQLTAGGAVVDATLGIGESGLYAFLVPRARLNGGTLYTVTLSGVRDLPGNALPATTTTFTTVSAPAISGFTPAHGLPGTIVTISGSGFDARAPERNLVKLGGVPVTVTAATATTLTVTIPATIAAGTHTFTVQTASGTATSADAFVVDNPVPILSAIAPTGAQAGSSAVTLIATGSKFVSGAVVSFGGTALATTFNSSTQLTAIIPATLLGTAGNIAVTVANPTPGGGASNAIAFEVHASNGAIGDFVWNDLNVNGRQDAGEPGIANVTVTLLADTGAALGTTTTDANGAYRFTNVAAGFYRLQFSEPASFAFTPRDDTDDAHDSDVDPATGLTDVFSVAAAQELLTIDAGLYRPPTSVESSPSNGATDVSVTRETIFRFSNALAPSTNVTSHSLFATFAGVELATRIHVSPDRKTVTLFYNQDLPASARIRVTLAGDELLDEFGRPVDADNDGFAGGNTNVDFDTLTLSTVAGTRVCGRVFASELSGNASVNTPLAGVIVSVDGMETTLRVVTDNLGNFCLDPAPAGKFFVHVDGRSATNALPAGDYYPVVGKLWESIVGQTVNIGEVYLPRVVAGTLQPVSRTSDTTITFAPSVLAQFPKFAGASITVPADALYSDGGSRGGMVGIAPVPSDRIPGPLPNGLELPLVITVQTDGASNFDRPVPVCLPNVPDHTTYQAYAPGELTSLYSFNHDTGQWEEVGPMHVTSDGRLVCSDPGFGILAPGWHGTQPPPKKPPNPPKKPPVPCPPPNNLDALMACLKGAKNEFLQCQSKCDTLLWFCRYRSPKDNPAFNRACRIAALLQQICELQCLHTLAKRICACQHDYCGNGPGCLADAKISFSAISIPDQIRPLILELNALVRPYVIAGQPLPADVQAKVDANLAQADALAGGDAIAYLTGNAIEDEIDLVRVEGGIGEWKDNTPPHPILYVAQIERPDRLLILRGSTKPLGQYEIFVPRNATLQSVDFYDPQTKFYGTIKPNLRPNPDTALPYVVLGALDPAEPDFDQDGVVDVVEFVYGTNPADADSDNDGISDGAEVEQGTNPLDGLPTRTGIIATAPTPADALDVSTMNDVAAVATGSAGVSLFNVFNGMTPTIIAQVDTPGSGQAVAIGGSYLAVADGAAGLAVIDITDPPAARIVHQVALGGVAQSVTVSAGIAYVGTDTGRLVAVDLASGTILQELSGLQSVHDLAIEGDTLFAATTNELRAYSLTFGSLDFTSKASLSYGPEGITGRRRLFVGGGIAYVAAYPGYDTIDVHDRAALHVIARAVDGGPNSFKQIVANGSGLGIAAVGANPRNDDTHDVWLYDLSNPAVTNDFLTILPTPGLTRAVSIYNGLAYAADGASGLEVLNYLPYDALGVPPTIQLQSNYTGGIAEEGQIMRVTAVVTDDVQVRNVQFFIDGEAVTDGNFPFEHRFVTPLLSKQASFTLSACATDTGGNRTCTAETRINLVQDITPPRVTAVSPANATSVPVGTTSAISATFSEPVDPATLSNASFQLFRAGADGVTGTADDVAVAGGVVSYRDEIKSAFLTFSTTLAIDSYRAVLSRSVADLKGNQVGTDTIWTFRVKGPNFWTNAAGGLFNDANNWSDHTVPGASDITMITLPGNYTVTVGNTVSLYRLIVGGTSSTPTLWIRGASAGSNVNLTVTDSLENNGLIRLESRDSSYHSGLLVSSGAFVNRGTIEVNAGTGGSRILSGALSNSGIININYSTPFDGTLTNSGAINVAASQKLSLSSGDALVANAGTIAGAGLVELSGSTLDVNGGTTTGTIPLLINSRINYNPAASSPSTYYLTGSNSTIAGSLPPSQTLWIRGSGAGNNSVITALAGFINNGTIRLESVDSSYQTGIAVPEGVLTNRALIDIRQGSGGSRSLTGTFVNEGVLQASYSSGLSGTFTNRGTINVAAGQTLSVSGANTVFHQNAGAINVDGLFSMNLGTFNFNGGTLATPGLMQFAGSAFNFRGGTTSGNAVVQADARMLYDATSSPATFAFSGASQVSGAIRTGQTLWVSGRSFGNNSTVTLADGVTNAGTIHLESRDSSYFSHLVGNFTNATGGVIEVFGGSGGTRFISGAINNQGTLSINVPTTLQGTFTNSGTVSVANNQTLTHNGANAVFIHNGGTFALTGAYELQSGRLDYNGGTTTGARLPLLLNSRLRYGTSNDTSTFILTGTCQVEGTINAAQTLWVRGSGAGNNTTVTATPSVTNKGTIRIESIDSSYQSFLAGDVTNIGTVESNAGSGGGRQISGIFRNQGTLRVRVSTSYNGTLTNSGTIDIASAQKLVNANPTSTFTQAGGTISGAGLLEITGATLQYDGGTTTGLSPQLLNSNLVFGSSSDEALFVMSGSGVVSGHIAPAQTLWIRGQGQGSHTTITAAAGLVNDGTIRLQSADSSYQSNLDVPSGVLTNRALIETRTGSGGTRLISGTIINDGTIQANHSLGITGAFTNRATVNVAAGQTLSVTGATTVFDQVAGAINIDGLVDVSAATFNHNGGTLAVTNAMQLAGGQFNFHGGTTTGNAILLVNSKLLDDATTSPAFFAASGTTQVSGALAAGQTLWSSGRGNGSHATIQLANGFTSAGTIRLESRDSSYESNLSVPSGSATSTGLIEIRNGTGGGRTISGAFTNAGTISVGQGTTYNGSLTNTGTIDILAGQRLFVTPTFHHDGGTITNAGTFEMQSGGTFYLNGGGTSGNLPLINNAAVVFGNAGASASLFITGSGPTISGDIKAGQSIWIAGSGIGSNTTVTAANGFTNNGSIRIESRDSSYQSNMTITSGALVNQGRVDINNGSGGSRALAMNVDNRGVFALNAGTSLSGTFDNNAGGTLSGTGTLTLATATLANHGTVSPGNSAGTLTVNRVAQAADGSLAIEIGATGFDRLAVTGNVTLDGTLTISLLDGFVPNLGATYVIVTGAPRTGTFATVNGLSIGGGRKFDVTYTTNNVTLTVVPE